MSIASMLSHSGTLQEETLTATGTGTHTRTWTNLIAGMSCEVRPIDFRDKDKYAQVAHDATHLAYAETMQSQPAGKTSALLHQICLQGGHKRLVVVRENVTRIFLVRGCMDTQERDRLAVMVLAEQPYSNLNN